MQHFINYDTLNRASDATFTGPYARYGLIALLAMSIAATAGASAALVWLGLALMLEGGRDAFLHRLRGITTPAATTARFALDLSVTLSFSLAPALAWYSSAAASEATAIAMLLALACTAAFATRKNRWYWALVHLPYAALGVRFLTDAAGVAAPMPFVASLLCAAYVAALALHHARSINHTRRQAAERTLMGNMSDPSTTTWEVDFEYGEIIGAERLSATLGRPVTFADIVDRACFAPTHERDMVAAAFAPAPGPARRIAIEHDTVSASGARLRVRHEGFLRTTLGGAPSRLTCTTRVTNSDALDARHGAEIALHRMESLAREQAASLTLLQNELGAASASIPADSVRPQEARRSATSDLLWTIAQIEARQHAIAAAAAELARARHRADAANLAKSQFLTNMSHELRTPLNAIIGYAEMLQEDADDNGEITASQDLGRILTAGKHLLGLLNEVLDLAKIEAGRMEASTVAFDARETLHEIVQTMRPLAAQNGNVLAFDDAHEAIFANTDVMKLRQCVTNLVSNACKFTRDGQVEVCIYAEMLDQTELLCVAVRDNGIGVSEAQLGRLFQPFVQAEATVAERYGGTGLGLAITRRLAQLLGGDVVARSALGKGSEFTLRIPLNLADAPHVLSAAATIDERQGAAEAPLVIVIEDEPDARELVARSLTRAGFAVQGVGGGEAGLALVRAKKPALVLLDIFLPDKSGWRVLQSLKHDPKTENIPVVVLSVNDDLLHALSLGAAEHLVKPADRDLLAATVMRLARKRDGAQATAANITPLVQKQVG